MTGQDGAAEQEPQKTSRPDRATSIGPAVTLAVLLAVGVWGVVSAWRWLLPDQPLPLTVMAAAAVLGTAAGLAMGLATRSATRPPLASAREPTGRAAASQAVAGCLMLILLFGVPIAWLAFAPETFSLAVVIGGAVIGVMFLASVGGALQFLTDARPSRAWQGGAKPELSTAVLQTLHTRGPLAVPQIAAILMEPPSQVDDQVHRLIDQGLIAPANDQMGAASYDIVRAHEPRE